MKKYAILEWSKASDMELAIYQQGRDGWRVHTFTVVSEGEGMLTFVALMEKDVLP